ncbi:MAG: hypothetical protein Ct9H90mP24_3230 [Methanobacteriota archaeon]|nr:MAG: hypothetical protein Ct9H90mP24_3230 [Euryarchaeota archaeon]
MGRTEVGLPEESERGRVEETQEVKGAESQPEIHEEPVRDSEPAELTREMHQEGSRKFFRPKPFEGQELEKLVATSTRG